MDADFRCKLGKAQRPAAMRLRQITDGFDPHRPTVPGAGHRPAGQLTQNGEGQTLEYEIGCPSPALELRVQPAHQPRNRSRPHIDRAQELGPVELPKHAGRQRQREAASA